MENIKNIENISYEYNNNSNNYITESILCIGNNSNGCFLKNDFEDCLKFTEIKHNLLKTYSSYKIKTGLKTCILFNNKKNEKKKEFFLWGKFNDEEKEKEMKENINVEIFPFFYKNFTLKNSIEKISIGDNHLLLLDSLCNLYSMGKGIHGELGLGKEENNINKSSPTLINFFFEENKKIIKCFTGMKSSFAISSI